MTLQDNVIDSLYIKTHTDFSWFVCPSVVSSQDISMRRL